MSDHGEVEAFRRNPFIEAVTKLIEIAFWPLFACLKAKAMRREFASDRHFRRCGAMISGGIVAGIIFVAAVLVYAIVPSVLTMALGIVMGVVYAALGLLVMGVTLAADGNGLDVFP